MQNRTFVLNTIICFSLAGECSGGMSLPCTSCKDSFSYRLLMLFLCVDINTGLQVLLESISGSSCWKKLILTGYWSLYLLTSFSFFLQLLLAVLFCFAVQYLHKASLLTSPQTKQSKFWQHWKILEKSLFAWLWNWLQQWFGKTSSDFCFVFKIILGENVAFI